MLNEARMIATADFRISPSGRKVHKMKKIADDDYHKEKDLDNDGDNDAQDKKLAKESVVPSHMQGKQKPYVSSDGKGNYEVLGNKGQTKAEFSRKEHGKDAQSKAQAHLKSKYNEYMKEDTELEEAVDKQEQRFIQLARLGLVDKSDVSKLRIAMDQLKADKPLTMQQRSLLLGVMSDLVGLVTGDDTIFQRAKMDLQKEETEIIEEDSVLVEYDSVNGKYVHKAKPGNYGGSAKDKHVVDTLSGPKKSELKDIEDKKKVKEEVEQIDEISKKTLGSYIKKASTDVGHKVATAVHGGQAAKDLDKAGHKEWGDKEYDRSNANYKKAKDRVSGIAKATDRLTKEELELDEGQMKRLATDSEEDKRLGSWRKETPWMKAKGTTTDKSGAKHTPMSTAKHLARLALKKQQSKTPQSK